MFLALEQEAMFCLLMMCLPGATADEACVLLGKEECMRVSVSARPLTGILSAHLS